MAAVALVAVMHGKHRQQAATAGMLQCCACTHTNMRKDTYLSVQQTLVIALRCSYQLSVLPNDIRTVAFDTE